LPFHGAFLIHEGRVRAHWPLSRDRAITSPMAGSLGSTLVVVAMAAVKVE